MSFDYLALNLHLHDQLVAPKLLLDEKACRSWPCSGWLYEISKWATDQGLKLISGDEAVSGDVDPSRVIWIQDNIERLHAYNPWRFEHDVDGSRTILFNLESPLFNPQFWDVAPHLKARVRMGLGVGHGVIPTFPVYRASDIIPPNPDMWEKNGDAYGCVLSNKWSALAPNVEVMRQSAAYKKAIAFELQSHRLRVLEQLCYKVPVRVAGHGFNNPDPFQLTEYVGLIQPITDKLKWLNQFRYAVSIENVDFPGYWSEKEWDPLVAGCMRITDPKVGLTIPRNQHAHEIRWEQIKLIEEEATHRASERRWVNELKSAIGSM